MPKKPTAPTIEEDPDAIDDETFAEYAADEERLHAALQDPQSIRTGQATIALTYKAASHARRCHGGIK